MNCGDVCLAHYPFTDTTAAKLRPVVVVSADRFNTGGDVVVLPISSKPTEADPYSLYIDALSPHFLETGLRYPSAIKWTKPLTIARSVITRRLGRLHQELLDQVRANLISVFS